MKFINSFQLFELHYTDIFPKKFEEFRKKYLKISKSDTYNSYFVQFTNFKGDVLDRTSQENTDHNDPMGNYAYPLKYVVNNPADLWYGMDANNLRILKKSNKCRPLMLSYMTESDCYNLTNKVYKNNRSFSNILGLLKQQYSTRLGSKNSGYWGRVFFQAMQVNLDGERNEKGDYPIRSEKEQTNILLRLGYNAIQDDSKKDTTYIINDREPQQICFLDRKSFDVIEIFNLKNSNKRKGVSASFSPEVLVSRKWVSAILNVLDNDKIKEQNKDVSDGEYYSVKGREVKIEYHVDSSYRDGKKLGQKYHREFKLSDFHAPQIEIKTEKGNILHSADENETISDMLKVIESEWNKIKNNPNIEGWIPRNLNVKKKEDDKKREEYYAKEKRKEDEYLLKKIPEFRKKLVEWKKILNSNYVIPTDKKLLFGIIKAFESYANIGKFHKDKILDRLDKDMYAMKNNLDNDVHFSFIFIVLRDLNLDIKALAESIKFLKEIFIILINEGEHGIYFDFYNHEMKESEVELK